MTKKLACPVCGGLNPRLAQRCETCGAVFETLPEELRPLANENEPDANAVPAASESEDSALDWLRSLIPPIDSDSESENNDGFEPSEEKTDSIDSPDLLGELFPEIRESLSAPDSPRESGGSADPEDPFGAAIKNAARNDSPETAVQSAPAGDEEQERGAENEFADFENHRPQPKWETEPIPENERADEIAANEIDEDEINSEESGPDTDPAGDLPPSLSLNEEKNAGSDAEPEESYFDFSLHRPQRKWDDERPSAAAAKSEPAAEPTETARTDPGADEAPKEESSSGDPVASPLEDSSFEDKNGDAENEYFDFSRHRPQRKWDDDRDGSDASTGKSAETETAAQDSGPDSGERDGDREDIGADQREYVDFSVHRPQDKVADAEAPETKAADGSGPAETKNETENSFLPTEESSLVSAFLAGLAEDSGKPKPEAETKPAPPSDKPHSESAADPSLSDTLETGASAVYDEISEFWNPVGEPNKDGEENGDDPAAETVRSGVEPYRKTPISAADGNAADEIDSDALIPDAPKTDGLDEIPWNLFDSGEMNFPNVPNARRDPISAIAKTSADAADYQQRMVAGILSKVFRAERRSRGFSDPRARAKNRLAIVFFALFAIIGVLMILGGDFRLRIAELPIRSGNAEIAGFAEKIDSASSADRFEIIFDYTFAHEAAFNRTAQSVIEKLRERQARIFILAANDAAYSLLRELYPEREGADALPIAYVPGPLGALTLDDARENADATILFAADAVRAQRWIETHRLVRPELPIYIVSTDQSAAILRPFARSEAVAGALLTQQEMAVFRGEPDTQNPTRQTALWFLIGTALAAIFLGTSARGPFTPAIDPSPNGGAAPSDAPLNETNENDAADKSEPEGERDA